MGFVGKSWPKPLTSAPHADRSPSPPPYWEKGVPGGADGGSSEDGVPGGDAPGPMKGPAPAPAKEAKEAASGGASEPGVIGREEVGPPHELVPQPVGKRPQAPLGMEEGRDSRPCALPMAPIAGGVAQRDVLAWRGMRDLSTARSVVLSPYHPCDSCPPAAPSAA